MRETHLAMAQRHVLEGRRTVQRQRDLIARQRERGSDTSAAEHLLVQFEDSLAIFEQDLNALTSRLPRPI